MEKGNAIAKKGVSGEQTLDSSLGKRGEMETCCCPCFWKYRCQDRRSRSRKSIVTFNERTREVLILESKPAIRG